EQQRARLDADRGSGRVARDQAGRDAEAVGRLAALVLVADHRIDLADEDRRLAVVGRHPLELRDVDVERVAEAEIAAGTRREVDAAGEQRGRTEAGLDAE